MTIHHVTIPIELDDGWSVEGLLGSSGGPIASVKFMKPGVGCVVSGIDLDKSMMLGEVHIALTERMIAQIADAMNTERRRILLGDTPV